MWRKLLKSSTFWPLLILWLAFGLRVYAIDRQDIWGDEAVSIQLGRGTLAEVVAGGAETVPPLYHVLLYFWLRLAGVTPLALRFLSAAFSTLAVPAVYVLGKRVFDRPAAILAAWLTAVSPAMIFYAQEARVYGVLVFVATMVVYGAVRLMSEPPRPVTWIAYGLSVLAAAFTHYYALFVVLGLNLVVVIRLTGRRRWPLLARWLGTQVAAGMLYLVWFVMQAGFLSGKASGRFDEWTLAMAGRIVKETGSAFAAGISVNPPTAWLVAFPFMLAWATASLVAVLTPMSLCHSEEQSDEESPASATKQPARVEILRSLGSLRMTSTAKSLGSAQDHLGSLLLVATLLVTFLLAWLINPIMPFFYPRYLLLVGPIFYLLVARGLQIWGQWWRPLAVAGVLVLLGGSGYGLRAFYTDDAFLKGRYGQMMAYVQEHAQPGDALILANGLQKPLFEYHRPEGLPYTFFPRSGYPISDPRTAQDLNAIAAEHPRLWLVRFGNPAEYDPDGIIHRWLSVRGSKAYFGGWVDADLSLYVMNAAGDDNVIQHPLAADLGAKVQLLGYALNTDEIAPGDTLLLTLYWQAQQPMSERYTVFTHLLDYGGQIRAQMDSEPQGGGLPTDRWEAGELVQDNYALEVAANAQPGLHVLEVGMYLWTTGDRLPVLDGDQVVGDRVLLGTVEVVSP